LLKNYLKAQPTQSFKDLGTLTQSSNAEIFYSTMPALKIGGKADNMAIIKPQSNERYTMLIKRIKVVDPLKQSMVTP
jgi:hypothetical protein